MEQSQKAVEAQRKRIQDSTMSFQNRLLETVLGTVLRKSNLQLDMTNPTSAASGLKKELVVVNQNTLDNIKELASGASGMPFFTANVELEQALQSNGGNIELGKLVESLRVVVDEVRTGLTSQLSDQQSSRGASMEYLHRPRNSYVIRLKSEAFAAIRMAFDTFSAEWRHHNAFYRQPGAWELIEGPDRELSDAFAMYAAHHLAHSRLFSGTQAAYLGVQPARANAIQMRVSLAKLCARGVEYVQRAPPPFFLGGHQTNTADVHRGGSF